MLGCRGLNKAPSFHRIISNYENTFIENHTFHWKLLELTTFSTSNISGRNCCQAPTAVLVGGKKRFQTHCALTTE